MNGAGPRHSPPGADDGCVTLDLGGEPLVLLPDRAAFLPRAGMLIVADVHLGKGQLLRRHGIPVPRGSTSSDLQRLDRLIERSACTRLLVLGDLVHAPGDPLAPWRERLAAWRGRHAGVAMAVVAGNHDRGEDLAAMGFEPAGTLLRLGAIDFAHAPAARARAGRIRVCGHVHPVIVRRDSIGRLRLPVFWQQPGQRQLVLPSFGALTGGFEISPGRDDRLYVATDTAVLPLR